MDPYLLAAPNFDVARAWLEREKFRNPPGVWVPGRKVVAPPDSRHIVVVLCGSPYPSQFWLDVTTLDRESGATFRYLMPSQPYRPQEVEK